MQDGPDVSEELKALAKSHGIDVQVTTKTESRSIPRLNVLGTCDPEAEGWWFSLAGFAFSSMAELQRYLIEAKVTELDMQGECCVRDGQPLTSEEGLEEFQQFCKENNIKFVRHPSG
jgi:hypothetical protein